MEKLKWIFLGPGILGFLTTCFILILALVRPENLWERSQAFVAFSAPSPDFRPVIVWDSNGPDYRQTSNIFSAVKDLSFYPPVLAPAETYVPGKSGIYFVRKDGSIFQDGPPDDLVIPVDSQVLIKKWINQSNQIVYKDNRSLQIVLERLPQLKKIKETELYIKKVDSNPGRPLLLGIPLFAFPDLVFKLFGASFCLFFWTLMIRDRFFDSVPAGPNFVLALVFVFSLLVLLAYGAAELRVLKWGWILCLGLSTALFFRFLWPLGPETQKSGVKSGLLLLFFACLTLTLFNPGFVLVQDAHRYLVQGEILNQDSGWLRGPNLVSHTWHVFSYPYAVGLFYSALFFLAGITPDQWPCADWRFSSVVLLNQVAYGVLNFLPLALFWESRFVIGRKMAVLLILCCFCLPTFWGRIIGVEGVLWPLLLLLFWCLKPAFPLRPYVQWSCALALAGTISLVKQDAGPIFLLLLIPAVFLETFFSKRYFSLKFILGVLFLGLIPLFVFKILNQASGVVCLEDFNPIKLEILRKALPDLFSILAAQVKVLTSWKPSFPIYGLLVFGIYLRSRQTSGWTRRNWIEVLLPCGLYFLAWTGLYLFSRYPSKPIHVWSSFDRLWGPVLLWIIFKVFYDSVRNLEKADGRKFRFPPF